MVNSSVLGGLIKRLYPDFHLESFENRLKLQKIIFLLQEKVVYLGYNFTLYIYGPYSPDLTKAAFYIKDFKSLSPVKFENVSHEQKFEQFISRISPFKDDTKWLEAVATIELFSNLYPTSTKKQILHKVNTLKKKFDITYLEKVWQEAQQCQILN